MKNKTEQYKKELLEVLHAASKDRGLFNDFIKEILTPREFDNLSRRWQIVRRLAKGEHHQAIAEALKIGVATVTRGSREMRKQDGGFRRALRLIHK